MLAEILGGLLGVPLELRASSYDASPQLRYRSAKRPNAGLSGRRKPDRSSRLLCDHREDSRQRLDLAGRLKPACSLPRRPKFGLMQGRPLGHHPERASR